MKTLLSLLTATLFLATASPTRAVESFFKVTFSGTVQTQTILGPNDGRIRTEVLNEKRILQQYGVSKQDYELAFGLSSGLVLIPKHASAMLPTITILNFSSSDTVTNTKAHIIKFGGTIAAGPASPTVFADLTGEVVGLVHFVGPFPSTVFKNLSFAGLARGTNARPGGVGKSFLNFKVVTNGFFEQKP